MPTATALIEVQVDRVITVTLTLTESEARDYIGGAMYSSFEPTKAVIEAIKRVL